MLSVRVIIYKGQKKYTVENIVLANNEYDQKNYNDGSSEEQVLSVKDCHFPITSIHGINDVSWRMELNPQFDDEINMRQESIN